MFKSLFAKFFRERSEAEQEAAAQFKAQIKEALLSQDSLRDAANQMRRIREASESDRPEPNLSKPMRRAFGSTPS